MQAIVTAIDDPYRDAIENIWGELKAVFGLKGVAGSTQPHLTYQTAEGYDATLDARLRDIAGSTPPFEIETHGIGVFRGKETVLYLHLTESAQLSDLHARLWDATGSAATNVTSVYAPATWAPHLTIAVGEMPADQLESVLRFLDARPRAWRIPVTNICVIPDSTAGSQWRRFDLGHA